MSAIGALGPTELDPGKTWDRGVLVVTRRWRVHRTISDVFAETHATGGARVTKDPGDGGEWDIVSVTASGPVDADPSLDAPLSDKWSLASNNLEKDIWTLPKVVVELNKATDLTDTSKWKTLTQLISDIKAFARGEVQVTNPDGTVVDLDLPMLLAAVSALGMSTAVFQGLIGALSRGVERYVVNQVVLRRVRTYNWNTTIEVGDENVGKIYTTDQLKDSEPIRANLKPKLPAGVWMKMGLTFDEVEDSRAGDLWQLTQEWWHADEYETFIYDPIT